MLDHISYSFEGSLPALRLANSKNAPVVFCSSETRAEIEVIRRQTDVLAPFIVENGGAVYIPRGYFQYRISEGRERGPSLVLELGTPYRKLVDALEKLQAQLGLSLRGFHQMTEEEIAAACGLSLEEGGDSLSCCGQGRRSGSDRLEVAVTRILSD